MMKFFQIIDGGAVIEEAARAVKITLQCANRYLHEANRKSSEEIEAEKREKDAAFAASIKHLVDSGYSVNGIAKHLRVDRKRVVRVIDEHQWQITWSQWKPRPAPVRDAATPCVAEPAIVGKPSRFDEPIPCRRCWKPFKSWGKGNRLCLDCRVKD